MSEIYLIVYTVKVKAHDDYGEQGEYIGSTWEHKTHMKQFDDYVDAQEFEMGLVDMIDGDVNVEINFKGWVIA